MTATTLMGVAGRLATMAMLSLGPLSTVVWTADPGWAQSAGRVRTGAEVLIARQLAPINGKRVGLITNQTGTVGSEHLVDILARSKDTKLVAIFAPEHGFRGEAEAGATVRDGVDTGTGIRVFSIYGSTKKPTPAMLRGVDVLVFDIQDVGVRYYTYISTMGLAMQAAAEAGIDFLVLDRPNPLGGEYVAGFNMEPAHRSFVGQFAIPMVHGLTVGELARVIKGRSLTPGLGSLRLDVVGMEGWTRRMRWPDTGLDWQRTSPNVPSYETALLYAGMGLFEAADASEGVGTLTPFQQAGTPWADGARIARELSSAGLPGVSFEPVRFTPRAIKGMVSKPRFDGLALSGVRLKVTDHASVTPVETGVAVFGAFARAARDAGRTGFIARPDWLAKLSGTRRLQALIANGADHRAIAKEWAADVAAFKAARTPYLLYP